MAARTFIEKAKIRIIPTTWIVNMLVTLNEILKLHTMYFKRAYIRFLVEPQLKFFVFLNVRDNVLVQKLCSSIPNWN